jgi:hypothetical protein
MIDKHMSMTGFKKFELPEEVLPIQAEKSLKISFIGLCKLRQCMQLFGDCRQRSSDIILFSSCGVTVG